MITTMFRGRHPEQYLHTLPHTHHIPLKSKPSYAEVSALGPASPSHVQLASLFLMFGRCCASGFRSVETFLAAPAFCTIFTAFSYYPTTCGLAAASPSSLQFQLLSQVLGPEPLQLQRLRLVRNVSLCNFCSCHR